MYKLILPNLYDLDDFNPISSHVIASLIQKVHVETKKKYIDVWGDGGISREFVYVKDAANNF